MVFCALGDGNKGITRASGTKHWKNVMFGLLLRKAFRDHQLQEQIVARSGLDYTIVRPSAFTDDKPTGNYQYDFDESFKRLSLKISRADVAAFMISQVTTKIWIRRAVSVSN